MLKIIGSDSFNISEPSASLINVHSRGLDKTASIVKESSVLQANLNTIKPKLGHSIIHLIALNDFEKCSSNRNGDGFKEKANRRYHDTFVKHAHVFDNHNNKDPKNSSGSVEASAYNEKMGRVELLISVDNQKWEPELQKLASGQDVGVSMGCRVPYDVCSICGNLATTPAGPCDQPVGIPSPGYCEHLKTARTQVLDDGRLVYMDNTQPLFFDISRVNRPADRAAYALYKAAGAGLLVPSGTDLAEAAGLILPPHVELGTQKEASENYNRVRKLAEIEKELDAGLVPDPVLVSVAEPTELTDNTMGKLNSLLGDSSEDKLGMLADAKILLSVKDFLKLLLGRGLHSAEEGCVGQLKSQLPNIFSNILKEDPLEFCGEHLPKPTMSLPSMGKDLMENVVSGKPMQRKIMRLSISKVNGEPADVKLYKAGSASPAAYDLAKSYAKYALAVLSNCEPQEENLISSLIVVKNRLK